jgi:hypothetical protein
LEKREGLLFLILTLSAKEDRNEFASEGFRSLNRQGRKASGAETGGMMKTAGQKLGLKTAAGSRAFFDD